MRRILLLCGLFSLVALAGCFPIKSPEAAITPTITPLPPTLTPSATIVWFPPTPTFTPFPLPSPLPAQPTPDQRPGIGDILYQDDFTNAENWTTGVSETGSIAIGKKELSFAIAEQKVYLFSLRVIPLLTNFYAEVTASPTFCQELDEYGILARASSPTQYYRFAISCDGQVRMDRVNGERGSSLQPWMRGAVPIGAPTSSRLGLWAVGGDLRFFVNDIHQFTVRDGAYTSGGLGFFVRSTGEHAVTVNFSDLVVYQVNP